MVKLKKKTKEKKMMDKNSVEYALQMFFDYCDMSDEEFNEKYPDEPDE